MALHSAALYGRQDAEIQDFLPCLLWINHSWGDRWASEALGFPTACKQTGPHREQNAHAFQ